MFRLSSVDAVLDHIRKYNDLSFTLVEDVSMPARDLPTLAEGTFVRCDFPEGIVMPDDMANALFVECRMSALQFSQAALFGAQFVRCDLSSSRFDQCDLSATQFRDCALGCTQFLHCDDDMATGCYVGGPPMAA